MRMKTTGTRLALTTAATIALLLTASVTLAQTLDFETYRTRVEPIFLNGDPDTRVAWFAMRRTTALSVSSRSHRRRQLDREQSRRNYENVSHLVKPGDPTASKLLIHPLAKDAGGDEFHGGRPAVRVSERRGLDGDRRLGALGGVGTGGEDGAILKPSGSVCIRVCCNLAGSDFAKAARAHGRFTGLMALLRKLPGSLLYVPLVRSTINCLRPPAGCRRSCSAGF